MPKHLRPEGVDLRLVLVGIYFIGLGGVVASRSAVSIIRGFPSLSSDELLGAAVGVIVGGFLMFIPRAFGRGTRHSFALSILGVLIAAVLTLAVALPIAFDGVAGAVFGGFLLLLPVASLVSLLSARRELKG